MKILADENFPGPVVAGLRKRGHDVLWARTQSPGLKDRVLLERAEAENRIVLTLDRDFWQLALQRPIPIRRSGGTAACFPCNFAECGSARRTHASNRAFLGWARQHCQKRWNRDDSDPRIGSFRRALATCAQAFLPGIVK